MQWYHWTLAMAALATAALAARWGLRRGVVWVAWLAADYVVSVGYLYMPKPGGAYLWWAPAAGVGMLCDAAVCVAIYSIATQKWEVYLYRVVACMAVTNFAYSWCQIVGWPPVPPRDVYGSLLEGLNYLALLLIVGTAALERWGDWLYGLPILGAAGNRLLDARVALRRHYRPSDDLRREK